MTRLHLVLGTVALAGAAAFAACSKTTPEPSRGSEPVGRAEVSVSSAPAATLQRVSTEGVRAVRPAAAPPASGPDELAWETPTAWQSVPNANAMRKATYKIPKAAGDADETELTVMAAAGGVDANIKRWSGQFGGAEAKTEPRTPNGLKVTVVELRGTYAGMGGMGGPTSPKERYMLLGAVVDAGERQHFFKMTGPERSVAAAKKDFDALVGSLRAK